MHLHRAGKQYIFRNESLPLSSQQPTKRNWNSEFELCNMLEQKPHCWASVLGVLIVVGMRGWGRKHSSYLKENAMSVGHLSFPEPQLWKFMEGANRRHRWPASGQMKPWAILEEGCLSAVPVRQLVGTSRNIWKIPYRVEKVHHPQAMEKTREIWVGVFPVICTVW